MVLKIMITKKLLGLQRNLQDHEEIYWITKKFAVIFFFLVILLFQYGSWLYFL